METNDGAVQSTVLSRRALIAGAAAGAALVAAGKTAEVALADSPAVTTRCALIVGNEVLAQFSELESVNSEMTIPVRVTASGPSARTLDSTRKVPTIVLKRPVDNSMAIWAWHQAVISGAAGAFKNCSLIIYDTTGLAVVRYALTRAWPAKLELASLKAGDSSPLMETLTIACHHIERVAV